MDMPAYLSLHIILNFTCSVATAPRHQYHDVAEMILVVGGVNWTGIGRT